MSRKDLCEVLRNPCVLNLVCALFALQRIYAIMGMNHIKDEGGHYWTFLGYGFGFIVGLPLLWDVSEVESKWHKRLQAHRKKIARSSYILFFTASTWLLFIVTCDVFFVNDPTDYQVTAHEFRVESVDSGDTFTITYDGEPTKCRFAHIDAPESSEPGYNESTEKLSELISGKTITIDFPLFYDGHGRKRDNSGRLLVSVIVDGRIVEEAMLAAGLASPIGD